MIREFGKKVIKSKRDSAARGEALGPDLISRFIASGEDMSVEAPIFHSATLMMSALACRLSC